MEISTQIGSPQNIGIEENHLLNIRDNIEVWEQYQSHPHIVQKKLIQTTAILQAEGLQFFSLNIKIPSTYFAGLEETYSIHFKLDNHSIVQKVFNDLEEESDPIELELNYHRINSIYDMNYVIQVVFNLLKQKLSHSNTQSLEILTSLIVFEMENLSKNRNQKIQIAEQMFSIENPHSKWTSMINITSEFKDYSSLQYTKYYH